MVTLNRILFACLLAILSTTLYAKDFADKECLECHGVKGYSAEDDTAAPGKRRALDVNYPAMQDSLHGQMACSDCHTDIRKVPHRKGKLASVDCITCHEGLDKVKPRQTAKQIGRIKHRRKKKRDVVVQTVNYEHSIHADPGKKNNANCYSCHTAHYVYLSSDPRSLSYRENSPQMCGECHRKALREYNKSIHAAGLKRPWLGDSATCSDCHSAHEIIASDTLQSLRLVTKNCGTCHANEIASYLSTTHGQLAWLGKDEIARCVDCHADHAIHKVDSPASPVSKANRLKTCRECHKDADAGIVKYRPHGNTREFDKYPFMYVTGRVMVGIVILVLIFFYSHSMLWFYREYQTRVIKWYTADSVSLPVRIKPEKKHSDQHFQRFKWYWRLNHWVLALSVMALTLTGMSVLYANSDWSMSLVQAMGGPAGFGLIHRIIGVIFLLSIIGHAVAVLKNIFRNKSFQWFGPDSLLPRKKDWHDMKAQFRWFFGKGEQPRFDRWTYWEKFDYWAVYWGAVVIGISGVILWASPVLLKFMPGWTFNVASIAHGVEAFLAVTTLFVVHFFNNHFRPAKFPLDTVMFCGSWELEEFKEERPLEYERLLQNGELEKHLVKPPSKKANIIHHILGFTLLTVGVLLLILVMIGFSDRGLV